MAKATTTPVRQLRERLGLKVPEFAKSVGATERSVYRWEGQHTTPSPLAKQKMRELHQQHQAAQRAHDTGSDGRPQRVAASAPSPSATVPQRAGIIPSRVPLGSPK